MTNADEVVEAIFPKDGWHCICNRKIAIDALKQAILSGVLVPQMKCNCWCHDERQHNCCNPKPLEEKEEV